MIHPKNRLQGLSKLFCPTGTSPEPEREFVTTASGWESCGPHERPDPWADAVIQQEVRGGRSGIVRRTEELFAASGTLVNLQVLNDVMDQLVNLLKEQYRERNVLARLENAEGRIRSLAAQVHVCSLQLEDLAGIVPVVKGLAQRFPDVSPIEADLFYAREAQRLEGAEDILAILRAGVGPEIQLTTLLKSRRAPVEDRLYELEKLVLKTYPGIRIDFHVSVGRKWDDVERLMAAGARLLYDSRRSSEE